LACRDFLHSEKLSIIAAYAVAAVNALRGKKLLLLRKQKATVIFLITNVFNLSFLFNPSVFLQSSQISLESRYF